MNDVEAIEQPIRKSAGGNPIEKRDRGPRDEPDGVTRPPRELESVEQFDQRVLNGLGHLLDSVDQQAPSRRTVKGDAEVVPQRLGFDRKIDGPELQKTTMRTRPALMNPSSQHFHVPFDRRRDEEPGRTATSEVLVRGD